MLEVELLGLERPGLEMSGWRTPNVDCISRAPIGDIHPVLLRSRNSLARVRSGPRATLVQGAGPRATLVRRIKPVRRAVRRVNEVMAPRLRDTKVNALKGESMYQKRESAIELMVGQEAGLKAG